MGTITTTVTLYKIISAVVLISKSLFILNRNNALISLHNIKEILLRIRASKVNPKNFKQVLGFKIHR